MFQKIKAIPLRTIRYSDKNSILSVWTAEQGRMSLLVSASGGRESRRRRALTMPMSILDCEIDVRPGCDVHPVREMRAAAVTPSVSANPVKAAVAMFMAEVVTVAFRDSADSDDATWQTLTGAILMLEATDNMSALANFPLWFMARMAMLTGIEPDTGDAGRGAVFDMSEGIFRPAPPVRGVWLNPDESRVAALLTHLPAHHLRLLRLGGADRRRAMDCALRYFGLHHLPLTALKSLPVLHALLR